MKCDRVIFCCRQNLPKFMGKPQVVLEWPVCVDNVQLRGRKSENLGF